MTASIPPSPRRRAAARAAGLRARARLWALAATAGTLALSLGPAWARASAWLDSRLVGAMAGAPIEWPKPSAAGLALLGLVLALGASWALFDPRRRDHEPGLRPGLDTISGPARLSLCVAALVLVLAAIRGGPASAARSVDAILDPGAQTLPLVWRGWLMRTLVALAVAGLSVGVIERLASAWRLWQGLHMTPAQAREGARASTRRPS